MRYCSCMQYRSCICSVMAVSCELQQHELLDLASAVTAAGRKQKSHTSSSSDCE
jgi:hypothetical protein